MLLLSAGRDVTELVQSYHPFSGTMPQKYLAARRVRALYVTVQLPLRFPPLFLDGFHDLHALLLQPEVIGSLHVPA